MGPVRYQPQLSLSTYELVGIEARVGSRDDWGGASARVRLGAVTRVAAQWRHVAPACRVPVWMRLSPRQLCEPGLVDVMSEALADAGVGPDSVGVEITEAGLWAGDGRAVSTLHRLHALGLHVAMHDFARGHASLRRLRGLPLELVKLDRSITRSVALDTDDRAIAAAIVGMAHGLGLLVLADGVDSVAQASCLTELGCDRAQGGLFGRPGAVEELEPLVA